MYSYPARFTPEDGGFVVTFPDIPEAITEGNTIDEALEYASDALVTALSEYTKRRLPIPTPSRRRGAHIRVVALPALAEVKVSLYNAMQEAGVRETELARRLGWQASQVKRLLDLGCSSKLEQIERALRLLGKRLHVKLEDAA